jgi:hypothetical protein
MGEIRSNWPQRNRAFVLARLDESLAVLVAEQALEIEAKVCQNDPLDLIGRGAKCTAFLLLV